MAAPTDRETPPPHRRFLLVSRVGKKSLHDHWLADGTGRRFDVLLSSYDCTVEPRSEDGVSWEYRPGKKVEGYAGIIADHSDDWSEYAYVAFWDEDLSASPQDINKMFELGAAHNLKIFQPSLSHDSYFTFASLLQQRRFLLRYVNFIEMMCPVFRRDILNRVAPLYMLGLESGIDLIWCNQVAETEQDFAVLDSISVFHTEPVGQGKAANGFTAGRSYEDDIYVILEKFSCTWLPSLPYSAILLNGKIVKSRLSLILSAVTLFPVAFRRKPVLRRLRALAVHLKHLLTEPARNIPASSPDLQQIPSI